MAEVKNIRILPVSKYSGDALTLSEWLANYYRYSKCYGWTDDQMVERLPLHLEGIALNICTRMTNDEKDTWEHLNENMKRKLMIGNPEQVQLRAFRSRMRKSGETAIDYAYAIRSLADRALVGVPDHQQNILILDQFLSGLNSQLRKQILITEPTTIDEALTKVMLFEQYDTHNQVVGVFESDDYMPMKSSKNNEIYRNNSLYDSTSEDEYYYDQRQNYRNRDSRMQRNYANYDKNGNNYSRDRSNSNERYSKNCTFERPNFSDRSYKNTSRKYDDRYRSNNYINSINDMKFNNYRNQSSQRNDYCAVNEQSGSRIQCYYCGQIGHMARTCRLRYADQEYGSRSNSMDRSINVLQDNDNDYFQEDVKCNECHRYGHTSNLCSTQRMSVFPYPKNNFNQKRNQTETEFKQYEPTINLIKETLSSDQINNLKRMEIESENEQIQIKRLANKRNLKNKCTIIDEKHFSKNERQQQIKNIHRKLEKETNVEKCYELIKILSDIKFKQNEIEPLIKILRQYRQNDSSIRYIISSIFKRYGKKSRKSNKVSDIIECRIIANDKIECNLKIEKDSTVKTLRQRMINVLKITDNYNIVICDDNGFKIEPEGYLLDIGCSLSDLNLFTLNYELCNDNDIIDINTSNRTREINIIDSSVNEIENINLDNDRSSLSNFIEKIPNDDIIKSIISRNIDDCVELNAEILEIEEDLQDLLEYESVRLIYSVFQRGTDTNIAVNEFVECLENCVITKEFVSNLKDESLSMVTTSEQCKKVHNVLSETLGLQSNYDNDYNNISVKLVTINKVEKENILDETFLLDKTTSQNIGKIKNNLSRTELCIPYTENNKHLWLNYSNAIFDVFQLIYCMYSVLWRKHKQGCLLQNNSVQSLHLQLSLIVLHIYGTFRKTVWVMRFTDQRLFRSKHVMNDRIPCKNSVRKIRRPHYDDSYGSPDNPTIYVFIKLK